MIFYYGKNRLMPFHLTQREDGSIPWGKNIFLREEPQICSRMAEPLQGTCILNPWPLSSTSFSNQWIWEKELDRLSSAVFSLYLLGSAYLVGRMCSDLQFSLWKNGTAPYTPPTRKQAWEGTRGFLFVWEADYVWFGWWCIDTWLQI